MSSRNESAMMGREFPSTHWSLVLSSWGATEASARALEHLCSIYWRPLYVFLRRQGSSSADAQDLVQGFLQRLLKRGDLEHTRPEKGRFRSYLITGLRNYAIKQVRQEKARKRGGGAIRLALDAELAEQLGLADLSASTPEAAFDRQWARILLGRALDRLRAEHVARGKEAMFDTLVPLLEGADEDAYGVIATRLNMRRGAVAVAVYRLRGRLRELLRAEVAQTVGSRAEADAELRELLGALAQA